MGSFVFKWRHPASEVYVTGTFDDWSKSESLEKIDDIFAKNVILPNISEKIHYKFVVDGNWITDHTAPQEKDESGNLNNVLTPDKIIRYTPESTLLLSGVSPESTTVAMAGAVPLEKNQDVNSSSLPGTFPRTADILSGVTPEATTSKMAGMVNLEKDEAELDTLPGTFPETAELQSGVTPDSTTSMLAAQVPLEKDIKGKSTLPGAFPVTPAVVEKGTGDFSVGSPSEIEAALRSKTSVVDERSTSLDSESVQKSGSKISENINNVPLDAFESEKVPKISQISDGTLNSSSVIGSESYENLEKSENGPPFLPSVVSQPIDLSHIIQSAGPESTTANLLSEESQRTSEAESKAKALPRNSTAGKRDEAERQNTAATLIPSAPPISYSKDIPTDNGFIHQKAALDSVNAPEAVQKSDFEATKVQNPVEKQSTQFQSSEASAPTISVPSRGVSPLTVTTVEGPITNPVTENCTTCSASSPAEVATGSTSPASFDKNEKKKKRLSLFGKIKAKLTHKEKD